jgi:hypothetical protein
VTVIITTIIAIDHVVALDEVEARVLVEAGGQHRDLGQKLIIISR